MKVKSYEEICTAISYVFDDIYEGLMNEFGADDVNSEKVNLLIIKAIIDEIGKNDFKKLIKKV